MEKSPYKLLMSRRVYIQEDAEDGHIPPLMLSRHRLRLERLLHNFPAERNFLLRYGDEDLCVFFGEDTEWCLDQPLALDRPCSLVDCTFSDVISGLPYPAGPFNIFLQGTRHRPNQASDTETDQAEPIALHYEFFAK